MNPLPPLFPEEARLPRPYLEPRQAQRRAPTEYENRLGDALEAAFSDGVTELDTLVARLNAEGLRTPAGEPWSAQNLEPTLRSL